MRSEGKVGKPGHPRGLRTDAFQIVAVDLADDSTCTAPSSTLR